MSLQLQYSSSKIVKSRVITKNNNTFDDAPPYVRYSGHIINRFFQMGVVLKRQQLELINIEYIKMLSEPKEECESLAGTSENIVIEQKKELVEDKVGTITILTVILYIFVGLLLFQITSRAFLLSAKQEQIREQLKVYQEAVRTLQNKMQVLNLTTGSPFTQEEYVEYDSIIKRIHKMESILNKAAGESENLTFTAEEAEAVAKAEQALLERQAVIGVLLAHSKEEIRRKKIEMFDRIAKKQEFQEEKVRNPWAMSRLNLRTPFIDTLERRHMEEEVEKQMKRLQKDYRLSTYKTQLPICVVVPTRNNAKNYRYEYNLQSIINQNYQNYKLVVVDDNSDDGTGDLISIFLRHSKLPHSRYTLVRNFHRMTAVPNINTAIKQHCPKDAIAVLVSGDDELLGKQVFKLLNAVYQSTNPGLAYTNHFYGKLHDKDFQKGYSRTYTITEIKNKLYRFVGQKFGHMRTFPVSIFNEIKEEHMKYRDGRWVQATYDETFILPILEMACDSIEYIDEFVYLYNYGTGENDGQVHHDLQAEAALYVRELPRYSCIQKYQKYVI